MDRKIDEVIPSFISHFLQLSNATITMLLFTSILIVTHLTLHAQHKGMPYWEEMLHYLMFHPMNQLKDLSPRLDKFRLGGRRPVYNTVPINFE
jgi:hypothetical protein